MAGRRRPTCWNRETPSPTWRKVPGLVGGFVHSPELTRGSAVPAEAIRQLFLGTATYSWGSQLRRPHSEPPHNPGDSPPLIGQSHSRSRRTASVLSEITGHY